MKHIGWFLIGVLLLVGGGCGRSKPSTLVQGEYNQQEMDDAIARARREVDVFIEQSNQKNGTDFAIKAPVKDGEKVEHFWLTDVVYKDGQFEGLIGNDPGVVSNVKFGDKRSLGKTEISDWMFMRDGKIHGNYTMRPLMKTLPAAEQEKMKAMLAEP